MDLGRPYLCAGILISIVIVLIFSLLLDDICYVKYMYLPNIANFIVR